MKLPWRRQPTQEDPNPSAPPPAAPPAQPSTPPATPPTAAEGGRLRRLLQRQGPGGLLPRSSGRGDAAARRKVVQRAEEVWKERHMRPFMDWFEGQVPSTDYMGPGGLRYATDGLWTLTRFYVEMHVWKDLGWDPPDFGPLRDSLTLDRRNFEILHRFFAERYPRVAKPWVIQPFADETMFWNAFREAVALFERGADDGDQSVQSPEELYWVSGVIGMMSLASSWSGYQRP